MNRRRSPWTLISVAFILGSLASTVLAGCRPAGAVEPAPAGTWPQLGGSSLRNNAPRDATPPTHWVPGQIDRRSGRWDPQTAENVRWVADLGSQTYGNPVIADGKVFVGTNNAAGYLPRYPAEIDLGVLLCFDLESGEFLWQHSSEKLASGRVHDWPLQGICSTPVVEGKRLWVVTNRGEVVCLDTEGFHDGVDDGLQQPPEIVADRRESDIIWAFDMMQTLGVSQRNMSASSPTIYGDLLFVNTGNGTGEPVDHLPRPEAPSFICLDKQTGQLVWADSSPGENILHGQWSSPAVGVLGGEPQVIFGGGDGYVYSFRADSGQDGKATLLWKFDCNPKTSRWQSSGAGDRNYIVATPVIHDGSVYIAVGQDPEFGEGEGCLWCIDPTGRGDVSPELSMRLVDGRPEPIPHRREQAVDPEADEVALANPNSAARWHYRHVPQQPGEPPAFEQTMHRTLGGVAIRDDLLYIVDLAGIVHCLDAGGDCGQAKVHFTFDLLAQSWSSPLIAGGHVYLADEDGDITIFPLGAAQHEPIEEINMGSMLHTTPVAAGDTLYISTRDKLYAIRNE